jgi:hypothetical protein
MDGLVWERCLKNREKLAKKISRQTKITDVFKINSTSFNPSCQTLNDSSIVQQLIPSSGAQNDTAIKSNEVDNDNLDQMPNFLDTDQSSDETRTENGISPLSERTTIVLKIDIESDVKEKPKELCDICKKEFKNLKVHMWGA